MKDLLITWPKSRPLSSYLSELEEAERDGLVINFRVSSLPKEQVERCYVVHDGAIRGYNNVLSMDSRGEGEVRDPITGGYWPAGFYIVRDPEWHSIESIKMKGFQGYRYFERPEGVR